MRTLYTVGHAGVLGVSFAAVLAIGLTGCGMSMQNVAGTSSPLAGTALRGTVHGGQQPVTGSSVYLFAAGKTGYSSSPTSLLNTSASGVSTDGSGNGYVTTDSNGNWTITGDYTCPASSNVYLLAIGGNPGLTAGTNNTALVLMAALGSCSALTPSTYIVINEVSTIASVYALSHFINFPPLGTVNFATQGVATNSTNLTGLNNAFSTVTNLESLSTGLALTTTPGGLGAPPQAEINTLADILSTCVNSNGVTGGCPSLFSAATPSGSGSSPANTLQAALSIARNPASNVATLFNLQPAPAPFQPVLPVQYNSFTGTYTGVPNDWTLAVVYHSSSWTSPNGLAVDSQGNVWLASSTTVAKLNPLGNQLETVTGGQINANNYNMVVAIDLSDRALIDDNSYWVSLIDSSGGNTTLADTLPLTAENIAGFGGVAVDASNNYWAGSAANNSSAVVTFNTTSGTSINGSYTGGGLVNPIAVAIDYSGNVWLANSNSSFANPGTVSKFSSSGAVLSGTSGFSGGGMNGCAGLAIDGSSNVWVSNSSTNTLTQLSSSGTPSGGSPYSGGGLDYPSAIAIDGDGNLWVSNFRNSDVSEFSSAGAALSPTLGFYDGLNDGASGAVSVDASGNVWLSDWAGVVVGSSGIGGVSEMIGAAAPTVTPIALALKNHTIGTRP